MPKFVELEKGTLLKNGKAYDYIIEIPDDFPKDRNIRLKFVQEKPIIRKVRTRYDPSIEMFGDKNASMEILLGYDMREIKKALRLFLYTLIIPIYLAGIFFFSGYIPKLARNFFPTWALWILIFLLPVLAAVGLYFYYRLNMTMLAEYLKARDIRKKLMKEGFKQKI